MSPFSRKRGHQPFLWEPVFPIVSECEICLISQEKDDMEVFGLETEKVD